MTTDGSVTALLAVYAQADEEIRRRGREWYAAARAECAAIAADTGYDLAQVAAVMAITSPDAQLRTNIAWTRKACESRGRAKVGKYPNAQRGKVRAALKDAADPGQYATGPKVSAFYRAIMGDESSMVVDRWAAFAAGAPRDKVPGAKVRRIIEDAYHQAADTVGESVAAFQAIVWIVVRETTRRADGRIHRLQDITA